jgi:hypothetical protein
MEVSKMKKYIVTVRSKARLFGGMTYDMVIDSNPIRLFFDLRKLSKEYEIHAVRPYKEEWSRE